MQEKKGKLIVIEGTDGSGKTVQWKMLGQHLKEKGHSVKFVDFPQYSKASAGPINSYLRKMYVNLPPGAASCFYAVDRIDLTYHKDGNMREWLEEGKIILANRYTASNGGHQGGKIKDEKELIEFLHWVFETEYRYFGISKPDLNIFLHVPFEITKALRDKRGDMFRDLHESDDQHLIDAERAYKIMVREFPEDFVEIECVQNGQLLSPEEIHEKVVKVVSERLGL